MTNAPVRQTLASVPVSALSTSGRVLDWARAGDTPNVAATRRATAINPTRRLHAGTAAVNGIGPGSGGSAIASPFRR